MNDILYITALKTRPFAVAEGVEKGASYTKLPSLQKTRDYEQK
jgi:hypothetical protein